jgi:hypothetical protein
MSKVTRGWLICVVGIVSAMAAAHVQAQLVTSSVPFHSLNSGYSESNSINWSISGPNWFFNNNNQVSAPFGPNLANTGTSGGFRFSGNGVSGNLGFNFAQGSNRSITSASPSVTTTSGYPGSFFSGELRPFVVGISPVVGGVPHAAGELASIAAESQQQMLSGIVAANADRRNDQLRSYLRRAERAEAEGDTKMARANYRHALTLAGEPLRSMIQQTLNDRFSGPRSASKR